MPARSSDRHGAWRDGTLIALFLLVLSLPLGARILNLQVGPEIVENRAVRRMPRVPGSLRALKRFPKRLEDHWNDTFGFRSVLIRWHSMAKVALGLTPSPRVILGKNGWLFLAEVVDDYRGTHPFTGDELDQWRRELEARHDWLATRGIRYLFVVAPEKQTIYGEFMPEALNRVRTERRLDQLRAHLELYSRVGILDVRSALVAEAQRERVYYQTDTHWNKYGSLVVVREIAARLSGTFPELSTPPRALRLGIQVRPGGDLAGMLGLQDRLIERSVEVVPQAPCQNEAQLLAPTRWGQILTQECPGALGPRLLLVHDSFGASLVPFLAALSRRTVSAWTLDRDLVAREALDVVVEQLAERRLLEPPIKVLRPTMAAAARARRDPYR